MKLLIADDDEQIKEGIKEGINWISLGIDEVIPASNGIEAFELFSKHFPEIVVTDIRMPGMDGLELFRRIKEIKPETKTVIISGYSDFEYLKKAIQLGVADYELKPIKVRNLIRLIKKAKDDILHEKVSKEKFQKYLESYKQNFINDLMAGQVTDRNIILEGFEQYFEFDAKGILLCIALEIDDYYRWLKGKTPEELTKPYQIMKDFLRAYQFQSEKGLLLKTGENGFVIIIRVIDSGLYIHNLRIKLGRFVGELNSSLESAIGISMSAGISDKGNASELPDLFKQARLSLKNKLYTGKKSVNYYDRSLETEKNCMIWRINEEDLKVQIQQADFDSLSIFVGSEFDRLKSERCYSKNSIISLSLNLLDCLVKFVKEKSVDLEAFVNHRVETDEIASLEFVDDYKDYVLSIFRGAINEYASMKSIKCSSIVIKAADFIRQNYDRNLTIEMLAEHVGKTPNYFSHLFKKEFGVSFSEYVNQIRVNKAKELILHSNLLIYEVGEKVGYHDFVYFTQVFKRIAGCSPTELRRVNNS